MLNYKIIWETSLLVAFSVASNAPAVARDVNRNVDVGKTARMWVYHSWDKECRPSSGTVKVLDRPRHGKLSNHVVESVVINDHWGRPVRRCAGRSIRALQVDYTSAPGYWGMDYFKLDVTWSNGHREIDSFNVLVK